MEDYGESVNHEEFEKLIPLGQETEGQDQSKKVVQDIPGKSPLLIENSYSNFFQMVSLGAKKFSKYLFRLFFLIIPLKDLASIVN